MSTSFYNLFQNSVISVSTRNYIFILKRLSTNIDFIQCLLTNKQSLRTTVQLLQYKELRYATPNFKILQTFFYLSLYGRFLYLTYYIQYLLIISIKTTPSNRMALFNKDLCSLVGGSRVQGPSQTQYKGHCVIVDTRACKGYTYIISMYQRSTKPFNERRQGFNTCITIDTNYCWIALRKSTLLQSLLPIGSLIALRRSTTCSSAAVGSSLALFLTVSLAANQIVSFMQ